VAAVDVKEEPGRCGAGGVVQPDAPQNDTAARYLAGEMACLASTPGGGALVLGIADDGTRIGTGLELGGVPAGHAPAYRLADTAQTILAKRTAASRVPDHRRGTVLAWERARGRVSSTEVADLTGLSVPSSGALLTALEEVGQLAPGRKTKIGRRFFYIPCRFELGRHGDDRALMLSNLRVRWMAAARTALRGGRTMARHDKLDGQTRHPTPPQAKRLARTRPPDGSHDN